jgi:hypothetical protein
MGTIDQITIPSIDELERRLQLCRTEQRELQRLLRMARAVSIANQAHQEREVRRTEGAGK